MSKKWIVPFMALLLFPLLLTAACAGAAEEDDGAYRIGVMESVTGPGETYGNVAGQAKQMAVEEINAAGGVNGRMLELIVEDSKCAAQDSITAYKKLTEVDGVKIILGTSCSAPCWARAPGRAGWCGPLLRPGHQPRHRQRRRLHLPHRHERPPVGHGPRKP